MSGRGETSHRRPADPVQRSAQLPEGREQETIQADGRTQVTQEAALLKCWRVVGKLKERIFHSEHVLRNLAQSAIASATKHSARQDQYLSRTPRPMI